MAGKSQKSSTFHLMKAFLIILLIVLYPAVAPAQQAQQPQPARKQPQGQPSASSPANILYGGLSFGGLLGGLSVNYERRVVGFAGGSINLRGGFGRVSGWDLRGNGIAANWAYLFGNRKHHLELNLGVMGIQDKYHDQQLTKTELFFAQWDFFPLLNAGYRFQKPEGGFMLRTGAGTELLYLGVGYSF
jgi:hypothetical protein